MLVADVLDLDGGINMSFLHESGDVFAESADCTVRADVDQDVAGELLLAAHPLALEVVHVFHIG